MVSMSRAQHRCFASLTIAAFIVSMSPLGHLAYAAQSRLRFFHPDHLGSTTLVTDEQGNVIEQIAYAPYGQTVTRLGASGAPPRFTGQRLDASTGLYYYQARYYDPQLGRFTQPDPIIRTLTDPQTLNRYAYVRNNPVNLVDPTGYSFWSVFKRVYVALVTFGMSETIPATTNAIVKLSNSAGIDPRYSLALYSAVTGAFTGGIGWGVSAAISGALASGATSLAMETGTGRQITRKVAKEFFVDIVGMSPRSAYTAASIAVSTAVAAGIRLLSSAADAMRKSMVAQSKLDPRNSSGISVGHNGDHFKLGGGRYDPSNPTAPPSPLGGNQGGPGSIFGIPYKPDSWQDTLIEAYAGPHDYLNNLFVRDYDAATGNIRQGLSAFERGVAGTMNAADVVIATPFAAAGSLPDGTALSIGAAGLVVDHGKFIEERR